jgi:hypothetical protein
MPLINSNSLALRIDLVRKRLNSWHRVSLER